MTISLTSTCFIRKVVIEKSEDCARKDREQYSFFTKGVYNPVQDYDQRTRVMIMVIKALMIFIKVIIFLNQKVASESGLGLSCVAFITCACIFQLFHRYYTKTKYTVEIVQL